MKPIDQYIIAPLEFDDSQFQLPRWNESSALVGPYRSSKEWETHFRDTVGVGDPILQTMDEFRFDPESGYLRSCRLLVPQYISTEHIPALDRFVPCPSVALPLSFECTADYAWVSTDGRMMGAHDGTARGSQVQICEDLMLLVSGEKIVGWALRDYAKYAVGGFQFPEDIIVSPELEDLAANYFRMSKDPDVIDAIMDDDVEVLSRIDGLIGKLEPLVSVSSQARQVKRWLESMKDV
jgi:hypothetical protein